ncbi:hypothetical protein A5642_24680 [Mycolicibacterium mucogenicum]|uniref:Uncharacterized protein n=2 Tax=Mycolicibacterium mucogenicum TaxID=56689 RepID=A0A1A0MK62_MYCMU|nr:hypothetical protein A5642_24680 [Mycolicibacterium mucogenicum]
MATSVGLAYTATYVDGDSGLPMHRPHSVAWLMSGLVWCVFITAGLPHAAVIHTKPSSDWSGEEAGATGDEEAADDVVGVDDADVDAAEVDAAGTACPPVCPQPVSAVVAAKPSVASDNPTMERDARISFTTVSLVERIRPKSPQFLHNRCR